MKSAKNDASDQERPMTMKERAKKARREAYLLAKERMKNDPRQIEFKAKIKEARREANAKAKEHRKNDPAEIARQEKLKLARRESNAHAKGPRTALSGGSGSGAQPSEDADLAPRLILATAGQSAKDIADGLRAELAAKHFAALAERSIARAKVEVN